MIIFTSKQINAIQRFKHDLANDNIEFAFEGTLLEGAAFLKAASDITSALRRET